MPRPPKPAKQHEYVLTVTNRLIEDTGVVVTRFEIRTTREFQDYQYRLTVGAAFDAPTKTLTLKIGGVSVPADLMPGAGPAIGGHDVVSMKAGTYTIVVRKGLKATNRFTLTIARSKVAAVRVGKEPVFIDLAG